MKKRQYAYAWFDREQECVVLSGIKFVDFLPVLSEVEGIVLIKHKFRRAKRSAGLAYVDKLAIPSFAEQDLYGWGDFFWCDYRSPGGFPRVGLEGKSKLRHFASCAAPRGGARIGRLANSFLVAAHDDGWYSRVFFTTQAPVEQLLRVKCSAFGKVAAKQLWAGAAFWIQGNVIAPEEGTHNVDVVINRRFGLTKKIPLD